MQNNSSSKNNVTYIDLQNRPNIVGHSSERTINPFRGGMSSYSKDNKYNQYDFYKHQANNHSGPLNVYNKFLDMTPLQLVGGMKSNKKNKCDFCNHAISNSNNYCSNCSTSSYINLLN